MSTDQSTERWLPIVEFPEHYEVSDLGRVRSVPHLVPHPKGYGRNGMKMSPGKIRRLFLSNGYPYLIVFVRGKRLRRFVHQMVLWAFVGPPPEGHECNHKDGNRANNHLDNLEWVTHKENMCHARDVIGIDFAVGEKNGRSKVTEESVRTIRSLSGKMTQRAIGKRFGIDHSVVSDIIRRQTWKHVT